MSISILVFCLNLGNFCIEMFITYLFFAVSSKFLLLIKKEGHHACWRNVTLVLLVVSCLVIVILLGSRDVIRNYETLSTVLTKWNSSFDAAEFQKLWESQDTSIVAYFLKAWVIFQNITPTVIGLIILNVYYIFGTMVFDEDDTKSQLTENLSQSKKSLASASSLSRNRSS